MLEFIFYVVIVWLILKIIVNGMIGSSLDEPESQPRDISQYIAQNKPSAVVIKIEQIKGWWYGFYHSDSGDIFVAQGTTFDEAVANCKERLRSDILKNYKIELAFTEHKK